MDLCGRAGGCAEHGCSDCAQQQAGRGSRPRPCDARPAWCVSCPPASHTSPPLSHPPSLLCPPSPRPCRPPQTWLLWLCTFHTNLVTCWLFFSLGVLFFLLAAGVPAPAPTAEGWQTAVTKAAGYWGFMVAATAFYDGTAALMKARAQAWCCWRQARRLCLPASCRTSDSTVSSPAPTPTHRLTSQLQDVYGKQILPVFPLKPVNKVSLGDFGTKRFVDPEAAAQTA